MLAKGFILNILATLFACLTACSGNRDKADKIDRLLNAYYQNGQFNGVVLVAEKDKIIYKKAFGLADREWGIPNTIDTKFRIASLSKPFTALLILQLAEEGKIDLESKIIDYIPDYKGKSGDSITIHQLLTHTSGLLTSLETAEENIQERQYHSLREMVGFAENSDLYFTPGSDFRYSNLGYSILAYIIEKVSGMTYADILKEKICLTAGLSDTRQSDNYRIEERLAKGYEYKLIYGFENASPFDASYTVGPGGLISTVEDLCLFDRALYSDKLISEKTKGNIFKSYSTGNYGYGWFIKNLNTSGGHSITIADHSGSINGFGAYIARIITDSSLVIVLKNQRSDTYIDPAFAPEIGKQIVSILFGDEVAQPKESVAYHIARLIGNYGIDSAVSSYNSIVKSRPDNYNMDEAELNKLGIELLFRFSMPKEALKIFEANMLQFPRSYNTYDSYAYVLMQLGDFPNSLKYYRKGLEILQKFPDENKAESVKKDAAKAADYIKEMEEKLKK